MSNKQNDALASYLTELLDVDSSGGSSGVSGEPKGEEIKEKEAPTAQENELRDHLDDLP